MDRVPGVTEAKRLGYDLLASSGGSGPAHYVRRKDGLGSITLTVYPLEGERMEAELWSTWGIVQFHTPRFSFPGTNFVFFERTMWEILRARGAPLEDAG